MKLELTDRQWNAIKLALTTRSELFESDIKAIVPGPMITEQGADRLRVVFARESLEAINLRDLISRHEDGEHKDCRGCADPEGMRCHG